MKYISMVALLILAACGAQSVSDTSPSASTSPHEIFLVRHAEKQTGNDPSLTPEGQNRAETLADVLADEGLTHIHSTNTKRTLETAAPIAALTGITVELYDAADLEAFAASLKAEPGVHLVVGHSNTTPGLALALGGDPGTAIDEATEYDRLYMIDLSGETAVGTIERFGVRYTPPAAE